MEILFAIIVIVLMVMAIVDVVKKSLPTCKKALWIALIVLTNIIGVIIYYLVGRPEEDQVQE